jgi:hypothetical protein
MERGAGSMEQGAWSTEHGAWSTELGAWSTELGAWSSSGGRLGDPPVPLISGGHPLSREATARQVDRRYSCRRGRRPLQVAERFQVFSPSCSSSLRAVLPSGAGSRAGRRFLLSTAQQLSSPTGKDTTERVPPS